MRACTAELSHDAEKEVYCPHLNAARDERDGRWVNRVPYYYSAYQHGSVSINSKASDKAKAALWDFFVYANVESLDVVSQKKGPTYLDPFRRSQLDISVKEYWTPPWSESAYETMRKVTLWAGQSPNVALPLAVNDDGDVLRLVDAGLVGARRD